MKKVVLYNLERGAGGEDSLKVKLSSLMFMRTAVQFNNENLKGLDRIVKATSLLGKLNSIPQDATEVLLEESEFELLKGSVDKCQNFGIAILLFPEFIDSILKPISIDVNRK